MSGIEAMTTKIVDLTKNFDEMKEGVEETKVISPTDGKPLIKTIKAYRSQCGAITINNVIGNRPIEENEVEELLKAKEIGPLDGFRSKAGTPFRASLVFEENRAKLKFEPREGDEGGEPIDLTGCEVMGDCPVCSQPGSALGRGKVYETTNAYICENKAQNKEGCSFRVSRFLLSRPIPPEQFKKLITEGKTDLLDKFKSKRTGKFFSAYVILKDNGQIGFEFEQKAAKKTVKKKTTKKKATA